MTILRFRSNSLDAGGSGCAWWRGGELHPTGTGEGVMRIGMRLAAAALAACVAAAGCRINVREDDDNGGDGDAKAVAAEDSARKAEQDLRDAGVTVDTQVIDSGQARAEGAAEADPDP